VKAGEAAAADPETGREWGTAFSAIHSAPIETVREHLLEDLDLTVTDRNTIVDFRGSIPKKGERRPRLLANTEITVPSLFGVHTEFNLAVAEYREQCERRLRGPTPPDTHSYRSDGGK